MWKRLTDAGREEQTLELLLRIGVAGCFIGHGAFGVIGKAGWLPYFAVAGIGEAWAWRLMPMVGAVDILVGVLVLLAPRPIYLGYAAFWAAWTALLRPLAGESVFETLERAGNYGVPIAFLLLAGASVKPAATWLRTIEIKPMSPERREQVVLALKATTATLLVGHGGLALLGKPLLASHAAALGLPVGSLAVVGAFELLLAGAVILRPIGSVLLFVLAWKLGTEALYPITGAPFWEFVERAGSYIAPLALWTMRPAPSVVGVQAPARFATLLMAIVMIGSTLGFAPASRTDTLPEADQRASLLTRLQSGGFVVACRHAITDRSRGDARRVDFEDRSTQRVLSAEGEAQARRLGEILKRKRIPIGEVFTSPYARTSDSARLAFGEARVIDALSYGSRDEQRRRRVELLSTVPTSGKNRALMTHQGVLYGLFPDIERGSIREGDCVMVQPTGDGYEVLASLSPDDWEALR